MTEAHIMAPADPRPLALRCALRGSRLIEASAGTGKTFTISALYLRLVEAAQAFRGELEKLDPILQGLRGDYAEADWPSCARKLDIAAQWMDQAAVSTIHSWCQRMLREHAFDSGSLFTQTLETDQRELLAEVARDYWRLHCYRLHGKALAWVSEHWQQPDTLLGKTRGAANTDRRCLAGSCGTTAGAQGTLGRLGR